jgi:hypothetical protein
MRKDEKGGERKGFTSCCKETNFGALRLFITTLQDFDERV